AAVRGSMRGRLGGGVRRPDEEISMSTFRLRGLPRAALWIGTSCVLASPARAADPETTRLRKELDQTKQELSDTKQQLDELNQRVAALEPGQLARVPATPPAQVSPTSPTSPTARLAPVNVDNPAISFVVDTAFSHDARSSWQSIGYPNGADFSLLNGEL